MDESLSKSLHLKGSRRGLRHSLYRLARTLHSEAQLNGTQSSLSSILSISQMI